MSDPVDFIRQLILSALDGDAAAVDRLLDHLLPSVHRNCATMLRRWRKGASVSRDVHQEVEDLVQEVWIHLFDKKGAVLKKWDPKLGQIETYVGYIARARSAMLLRSPRSPWREHPVAHEDIPDTPSAEDPEEHTASRDLWRYIQLCLYARFKPRDFLLYEKLFVQQRPGREVAEEIGDKENNLHKWLSRLRIRALRCREQAMAA